MQEINEEWCMNANKRFKIVTLVAVMILCSFLSACNKNKKNESADMCEIVSGVDTSENIAEFKKGIIYNADTNELTIPKGVYADTYSTDMMTDVTSKTGSSYMKRTNRNDGGIQADGIYDVTYEGNTIWEDLKLEDYIREDDYVTCDFYIEDAELDILIYDKSDNEFMVIKLDSNKRTIIASDEVYKCEYDTKNVEKNPLIDSISTPLITSDKICYPTVGGYIYEISRTSDSIKQVLSAESIFESIKAEGDYTAYGWIRVLGYSKGYYLASLSMMIDKTAPEAAEVYFIIFDRDWNVIAYGR